MNRKGLTSETENFFRYAQIVLDDVPKYLRDLFKDEFQKKYRKVWVDNGTSGKDFVKDANLTKVAKKIGTVKRGNTEEFDGTLLFSCLLDGGVFQLDPQVKKHVSALKSMRNDVAHATAAAMPVVHYQKAIADLEVIYRDLHWDDTELRRCAYNPLWTAECVRLQEELDGVKRQELEDELHIWGEHLRKQQKRRVEEYVRKSLQDGSVSKHLLDMYVDLRIHNKSENFKRIETRTHHDRLQLEKDVDQSCRKIDVKNLFLPEQEGLLAPSRVLVVGKAGIGKTMLSTHILDLWLNGQFPVDIDQLFYFPLRELSRIKECSLRRLFFLKQGTIEPSSDVVNEFFKNLRANPGKTLILFDGLDEFDYCDTECEAFEDCTVVEMSRLISSILGGHMMKEVRLLVTSRPGGVIDYDSFDRRAEIYGFTRDRISKYIAKFSKAKGDDKLAEYIEAYISRNVNITSFCYIPLQCNLVCRCAWMNFCGKSQEHLPETLTELFVMSVKQFADERHQSSHSKKRDVIAERRETLLSLASLAKYGMEQTPIKVTFLMDEINGLPSVEEAMQCGLMTESRETHTDPLFVDEPQIYYFQHLTMQEFLAAGALVCHLEEVRRLVMRAPDRQLDLVLMFLAGLLGNGKNHVYLRLLDLQWDVPVGDLIKLVVERERSKEDSVHHLDEDKKDTAHKTSVLLLLMLVFESRCPELWSLVSDYALRGDRELDLTNQRISPVELQAVVFILPKCDITSLNLSLNDLNDAITAEALGKGFTSISPLKELRMNNCRLSGAQARTVTSALEGLKQLEELDLSENDLSDLETAQALGKSLASMPALRILWLYNCRLNGAGLREVINNLHGLQKLEELSLGKTDLRDVATIQALSAGFSGMTQLRTLWLEDCYLMGDGARAVITSLSRMTELRMLELEENCIGDKEAVAVMSAAVALPHMEWLGLGRNHMTAEGQREVKRIAMEKPELQITLVGQQEAGEQ